MDDLISRQDAIDMLAEMQGRCTSKAALIQNSKIWQRIKDLPSAQPTADAVQVVRCKDCRHRDPEDHKCDSGGMERQGCPFKVADDYFCAYGER